MLLLHTLQFIYKEVAQYSKAVELDFADYSLQLVALKINFTSKKHLPYLTYTDHQDFTLKGQAKNYLNNYFYFLMSKLLTCGWPNGLSLVLA